MGPDFQFDLKFAMATSSNLDTTPKNIIKHFLKGFST
jgi:hypothetical protein